MRKSTFRRVFAHFKAHTLKDIAIIFASFAAIALGAAVLWVSSFRLPDLSSFEQRKVSESTKIYDRTGKVLLYDLNEGVKRTVVSSSEISDLIKRATVAIEDADFYDHNGIKISSFIRAVLANLKTGEFSQGGSTITQQVVKNTLLTQEKKISRKLKEWVLAIKLDKALTKDEILTSYLNENPYGGAVYGVQEASRRFFGKSAKDVTLAEAAYLAAIPQATTYYSPYGKNVEKLEDRKNLVLRKMVEVGYISEEEYEAARKEKVAFQAQEESGIKAPHFVFFVKDYLEGILGEGFLEEAGYKVVTTLDIDLQEKAQDLVKATARSNQENFDAENAALVALDPKTGDILSMVGSRDYFDKEIDGKFNVATSPNRQPGSTMKPIIYARAFEEGYTPETILFDLETEFSSECTTEFKPKNEGADPKTCYHPKNYDDRFRGPISLREALAQSINVPSVKLLYLAGVRDSLSLAKDMGITTLTNANQYGLTLVLGGGETSLLEMTSAYGTFAAEGVHVPYKPVIALYDAKGKEIRLPSEKPRQALSADSARAISDILSDNAARTPAYGANSVLYFPDRDVAVKTGTTNDSRDAWTIGYSPNIVVGVWAGNNDNAPMVKKVAGQIVAPMWSSFMKQALQSVPDERFSPPSPKDSAKLKPVMKGIWQGGTTYTIDTISGKLATEFTPAETKKEVAIQSVHSILHWLDKDDPLGPAPLYPQRDSQYEKWEFVVRKWALENGYADQTTSSMPTQYDDVHTAGNMFTISIQNIEQSKPYGLNDTVSVYVNSTGKYQMAKASLYVNGSFVETTERQPFIFRFSPSSIANVKDKNMVRIVGQDSVYNRAEASAEFSVALEG
ncbi:MAG: PBP1A family penicillin-binding protein [Candidatus Taylorbacteria bacterium]|nr:PBP1A family penicillin-binding protein [Candidatus Taylorbacteria bacterium]